MKIALILIVFSTSFGVKAQQDFVSSAFWNNYAHVNPAMSSLEFRRHASFMYRRDQFGSSYSADRIMANANILLAEKHGVGVVYDLSTYSLLKSSSAKLNYNYRLNFSEDRGLSFGASIGVTTNKLPDDDWDTYLPSDTSIQLVIKGVYFTPSVGLGYNSRNFMLGFGITNIAEGEISNLREDEVNISPVRNYYLNGHYKINLGSKKNLEIRPQILVRTDLSFTSIDLNALVTYKKRYWAGITYRNRDAFAFMLGWDIKKKVRVGYSFDWIQSKLTTAKSSAHELGIGIFL